MDTHLKKVSDNYQEDNYQEDDSRIHPISEIDAELITVLIDIIDQRGWTDLSSILREYKKIDDEFILDRLAEYSISIDGDLEEQPKKNYKEGSSVKEFVIIGGRIFRTFGLFTFRKINKWDEEKGSQSCIIINEGPLPGSAQWYMDTNISFESQQERDKEWLEIQNKMKKQNCLFL